MEELIEQLQQKAGLTREQAEKAIQTIKDFVVEKFPMMEGMVSKLIPGDNND
jgi:nucleoid DNA-binding protein